MRYARLWGMLPLAAMVGVVACAEMPREKLDAASSAQEAAVAVDAATYAPEAYQQVVALRGELDTELAVQAERYAVMRKYDRAVQLSDSLKLTAEAVRATAMTQRETIRQEAAQLLETGAHGVTELTNALAVGPAGKGTSGDLMALRGDVAGVSVTLGEAQAALDAGNYMEARAKATAANEVLANVRQSIEQARVMTRTT
jgi:hypothetical protein